MVVSGNNTFATGVASEEIAGLVVGKFVCGAEVGEAETGERVGKGVGSGVLG